MEGWYDLQKIYVLKTGGVHGKSQIDKQKRCSCEREF